MKRKLIKFLSVFMAASFLMIGSGDARPEYAMRTVRAMLVSTIEWE